MRVIPWNLCQQTILKENLWNVCEQKEIIWNLCKEKILKKSFDICAGKVSIKKFLETFASKRFKKKFLETYVSKTSRKKSLCKQKLLKKPLKLVRAKNILWNLCKEEIQKKNPLKLVQGKISGMLRKMWCKSLNHTF